MRQGPHSKRLRGRGNGRKNTNVRSQSFESNGPDVKVRGNAQQVVEKYLQLARDASSSGDRIAAEGYLQHAEHYQRLMNAHGNGYDGRGSNGAGRDGAGRGDGEIPGMGPQPDIGDFGGQPEAVEETAATSSQEAEEGPQPAST